MNVGGVPDSVLWGRESGRNLHGAGRDGTDGADGTVVTTCSSITIKKSNVSGMAQRNPQFAYETIELFMESTHAPTLQFLENDSALLLMMVQGAQGLTEQQITNERPDGLLSVSLIHLMPCRKKLLLHQKVLPVWSKIIKAT